MNKIYAGIGARKTPSDILTKMQEIAKFLAKKDYTLRSGGADGADFHGFETGCDFVNGKKEIYLPWLNFNNSKSKLTWSQNNWDLAANFHPNWDGLKLGVKQLMARNSAQITGLEGKTFSDFVVCWTEDGKIIGGTAQALRIAKHFEIPIFNLGSKGGLDKLRKFCKTL